MAWRPARSLTVLRDQIQAAYWWAAPPATPVTSWGMYGDAEHDPESDHVPHDFPGWGEDIVTALDFPHRTDLQLDAFVIVEAIRLSKDPRVKYVIFNKRQYSSYWRNGIPPYTWRPYSGTNPHTDHAHVSVVGDSRADGVQLWQIGEPPMLTPDQQQQLANIHSWLLAFVKGETVGQWAHTNVIQPNVQLGRILAAPPMTDEQVAALAVQLAPLVAALLPAPASPEAIADAVVDEIAS